MSTAKWMALLFAALAAIFYRYYEPLPDCLKDAPLRQRVGLLLKPTFDSLANVVEFTRLASKSQFQRGLLRIFYRREADSEALSSVDTEFDGVHVRVYVPARHAAHGAALFYIHGGAWVLQNVNTYDSPVRRLALELGLVTISVDYRLAPEFPYPTAVNDVERAFRYFVKHVADFDVDPNRIAVIGDSAGGNMAAVLAIRLRDAAESKKEADAPRIKFQVLLYPNTQVFELSTLSRLIHINDYIYPIDAMVEYRLQYILGMDYYNATLRSLASKFLFDRCYRGEQLRRVEDAFKSKVKNDDIRQRIMTNEDRAVLESMRSDEIARTKYIEPKCGITDEKQLVEIELRLRTVFEPDASPLLASRLDNLPPAYVITAGVDGLHDDGLFYIERLRDAGVVVYHRDYAEECHGFLNFGKVEKVVTGLRHILRKYPDLL